MAEIETNERIEVVFGSIKVKHFKDGSWAIQGREEDSVAGILWQKKGDPVDAAIHLMSAVTYLLGYLGVLVLVNIRRREGEPLESLPPLPKLKADSEG